MYVLIGISKLCVKPIFLVIIGCFLTHFPLMLTVMACIVPDSISKDGINRVH